MENTVGKRIKESRKRQGISQRKLATKIGIKVTTLSAYETDTNDIPSKVLLEISKVLEISTDYLLFGTSIECVEEQKIRALYNKIETPALKKLALSQIKCIAEIENSINYE